MKKEKTTTRPKHELPDGYEDGDDYLLVLICVVMLWIFVGLAWYFGG